MTTKNGKTRKHNRCGGRATLMRRFKSDHHLVEHFECGCGDKFAIHYDKNFRRPGWTESAPMV